MKKIILSFITFLTFQLIPDKKRAIKKGIIYLALAIFVPNIVFSQSTRLDKTFGMDGRTVIAGTNQYDFFNNELGATAIQKDGKILTTGPAINKSRTTGAYGIMRLNSDGSLDKSFSGDGKAFAEMSNSYANPWDMCIAPDGKIIVTGDVRNVRDGVQYFRFGAARFNADGTLDNSFDADGIVLFEEATRGEFSTGLALQDDGKILLAGYGVNPKTNDFDFKIILLNENGSIDNNFGENGVLFIGFGNGAVARRIRLQPDRKIVIAGDFNAHFAIARLNRDGSLDTTFGSGGKTSIDFNGNGENLYNLLIQDDGKILVSGTTFNKTTTNGVSDYALARLNANGTLDSSFAVNGKKTIDFSNADDQGSSVIVQKNGSILMVGSTPTGIEPSPNTADLKVGIVRLLPDGNFDTAFDDDGKQLVDLSWAYGVFIQPDEKVVVGGSYLGRPAVARLIFDNSFPPILASIGNKSVNELAQLKFTVKATDNDSPVNTLIFSLARSLTGKFPEGATIDSSSGLFCWTPTEAQGPGTYRVKIMVSDGLSSDEEEIEIKVCEVNAKPVLSKIGNQTVDENKLLTFTAKATDKDIPGNTLTFSLADPASGSFPTGASINASTGIFSWLPAKKQVPGDFRIKVIVSDGIATDYEEFAIKVCQTSPVSLSAYPNPLAHRATVRFAVPANEEMVTLVLYDYKGMQINRLYEGRAEANRLYSFDVDGSNLSPGVYLIRLSMSQKAETFKMIITE